MTIFSVHIPKTGGTTFLEILRHKYGNGLVLDYGLPRQEVEMQVASGTASCVHGHYVADKYAAVENGTYVTWLRHPIDRLVSAYNFWKSYRYPDHPLWRQFHYDNWDFMQYAMSMPLRNEQSKYLRGVDFDRFQVVGITEFFDESMALFKKRLEFQFDDSKIPHHRKADKDKAAFDPASLSKRDVALLMDCHRADFILYMRGIARFRELTTQSNASGKIKWGPIAVPPATGRAALSDRNSIGDKLAAHGIKHIRGTYFFGDGWPITVWDSFRREVVADLLGRIKRDGYNTVILLVPAGLTLAKRRRPEFYDLFLEDFRYLTEQIKASGLYLGLRLGFAWDGFPIEGDRGRTCFAQLSGGSERELLKQMVAELWEIVSLQDNCLFGLITWEDMLSFPINRAPRAQPAVKANFAREVGFGGHADGIPSRDDPDFRRYLEHLDDKFSDLFYDLKSVFPRLTAEVRVDTTPFTDAAGDPGHFVHNRQIVELDSDVIGTYFGTYMMHGPLPRTAEQALHGMDLAHLNVRLLAPNKKAFVDQFNFVMDEKTFSHFAKMPPEEEEAFLDQAVDWFDDSTVGYATWSFVDYPMDVVSNGAFRLGLEGWSVTGEPNLVENGSRRYVELKPGDTLRGTNIKHYSPWIADGWIVLEAELAEDSVLRVVLSDGLSFDFVRSDFHPVSYGGQGRATRAFEGKTDRVEIEMINGAAKLMRVSVGHDICSNGGHSILLEPTETSARIAKFNQAIAAKSQN